MTRAEQGTGPAAAVPNPFAVRPAVWRALAGAQVLLDGDGRVEAARRDFGDQIARWRAEESGR